MGAVVVVVNLSETTANPVDLALSNGLEGELQPAFPDRPSGLKLAEGKLTGQIGKSEVHVYRMKIR